MSDDIPTATKGDKGDTGAPGAVAESHWYSLTDRRLLSIFLVFVLAGTLVLQGLSHQQGELRDAQDRVRENTFEIQDINYQRCLDGREILAKFNRTQRALAALELSEPKPDSLREERARIYLASVIPLPNCDFLQPFPR